VATLAVTERADLTDAQWAVLEPFLPRGTGLGRPPKWTKRQLIDGISWQRDGTWAVILAGLQARADAAGLITWDVSVDSTIMRAHQHAAGARKRGICRPSRPAA
jgi:transposase